MAVGNRIAAALLDVHPAVLWHEKRTGENVEIGRYTECYDCSASPYTERGKNLFAEMVRAWVAAGRP